MTVTIFLKDQGGFVVVKNVKSYEHPTVVKNHESGTTMLKVSESFGCPFENVSYYIVEDAKE